MRILLANDVRAGAGGVETYLAALASLLELRGSEVALLHDDGMRVAGPTTIATTKRWSVQDDGFDEAVRGAIEWRPDVCFSHNMRRLAVDEALLARVPVVKMMHGYFGTCVSAQKAFGSTLEPCSRTCGPACLVQYVPRRCGQLRPGAIVGGYRWAARQRRLFASYTGIVVASEHMRGEYMRHGVPSTRVHMIPLFAAGPVDPPAQRDVDIVFLARLTPLKGGESLLRAVDAVAASLGRRLSVVMAGNGPELARLESIARKMNADVRFPGWIDEHARSRLLARARVLAIPSRWPEPFGLVGLEAASAGVPAVAFDVGGISQWLEHDVNGLLVDIRAGAEGLGAALARVLNDDRLRTRLSSGATASGRRYTAEAHATALEPVLARAAAR